MRVHLLLLTLLFILTSCLDLKKDEATLSEVDYKISSEWIYTQKIEGPKINGEVMQRPPGVEQYVMGLTLPGAGDLSRKLHCVYYQIPYKSKLGKLSIFEIKNSEDCPETAPSDETFLSLDNITQFKVTLQNFKLKLEFEKDKKQNSIDVALYNMKLGDIHEKYLPVKEKRLFSGMRLLKLNDESFDLDKNKYLGKITDRFSRGSAIRCHQVNKNCETVGENRCGECRYGWYEVVDFNCAQGGSKFCGQNHCGEKNEPACPRGNKVVTEDEAGICQNDLEPVANADKILVCQ